MRFIWDTDMTGTLGLKGNELLVYSVVNSFSQGRKGCFYGSLEDLAEIIGAHKNTADNALTSLVEKCLIDKYDIYIEGVRRCAYCVSKNCDEVSQNLGRGYHKNCDGGITKSVSIYNEDNKSNNKTPKGVNARVRFDFASALMEAGVSEQHTAEWMDIRKSKKAVNTDTAFKLLLGEAARCGISVDQAVTICVEESWKGFRKEYYDSLMAKRSAMPRADRQVTPDVDRMREISARLRGGSKSC